MSATLNPKLRQAFALAHAVPFRKDKKAIAHKLVEVLREAINASSRGYEKHDRALPPKVRAMPEVRLWLAVIGVALVDASSPKSPSARNFFSSDSFVLICDAIGLDAEWVRELVRDHAAWMREGKASA